MPDSAREREWEQNKRHIWKLWVKDRISMPKLQTRMEQLGFVASVKEYRSKLEAWGISKNVPATMWKHIGLQNKKRRRETGNPDDIFDVFMLGVRVDPKRVKLETSRHFYNEQEANSDPPCPLGFPISLCSPAPIDPDTFSFTWPNSLPWLQFNEHIPFPDISGPQRKVIPQIDFGRFGLVVREKPLSEININHCALHLGARMPEAFPGEHVFYSQCLSRGQDGAGIFAMRLLLYQLSNNLYVGDIQVLDLIDNLKLTGFLHNFSSMALESITVRAGLSRLFGVSLRAMRSDIISWLLRVGVDPNRKQRNQKYHFCLPICIVVSTVCITTRPSKSTEWAKTIELLVAHGSVIDEKCCSEHISALDCAAEHDEAQVLDCLVRCGIQKEGRAFVSNLDWTSLYCSATIKGHWQRNDSANIRDGSTFKYLLDLYASEFPHHASPLAMLTTPEGLLEVVRCRNVPLIRHLGHLGTNFDCCDKLGNHPLLCLVSTNCYFRKMPIENMPTFVALIEAGASMNYRGFNSVTSEPTSTAFQHVLESGLWEYCLGMLRYGADPNAQFYDDDQHAFTAPLTKAASQGCWHEVGVLLDYGANIKGDELFSLMQHPTNTETVRIVVRKLVANNFDLASKSSDGKTAVQFAIDIGQPDIARILVEEGAISDVILSAVGVLRTVDDWVKLNFSQVLSKGMKESIATFKQIEPLYPGTSLLEAAAKTYSYQQGSEFYIGIKSPDETITRTEEDLQTVLAEYPSAYSCVAVCRLLQPEIGACYSRMRLSTQRPELAKEILERRPSDWQERDSDEVHRLVGAAVSEAVINGNFEFLEEALPDISKLRSSDPWLWHCPFQFLWLSVFDTSDPENEGCRRLILDRLCGAGYKAKTISGLAAAELGSVEEFKQLVASGLDPRRRYIWSPTFLQLAIYSENIELAVFLINRRVKVNAVSPWAAAWDYNPLESSADYGVHPGRLNSDGGVMEIWARTALQIAVEKDNLELISMLLNAGAHVNAPAARFGGATALQVAAMNGSIGIANLLISRNADVNAKGAQFQGRTALEGAAENGRLDMVQLLIDKGCELHGKGRRNFIRAVVFARDGHHDEVASILETQGSWGCEDEIMTESVFHECCDKSSGPNHEWKDPLCIRQSSIWHHTRECCDETESISDSVSEPCCWEESLSTSDFEHDDETESTGILTDEQSIVGEIEISDSPISPDAAPKLPQEEHTTPQQHAIPQHNERHSNFAESEGTNIWEPPLEVPEVDFGNLNPWDVPLQDSFAMEMPSDLLENFLDFSDDQPWCNTIPWD